MTYSRRSIFLFLKWLKNIVTIEYDDFILNCREICDANVSTDVPSGGNYFYVSLSKTFSYEEYLDHANEI